MAIGIDVYTAYQAVHDWAAVRGAGYKFVYVKLTDGMATRSEGGYTAGARAAGIAPGGYHYAQPGDPRAQADFFTTRCEYFHATELAPALDLESPFVPGPAAVNFAVAFCRRIRERGHRPALYANNSMMRVVAPAVLAAVPSTLIWVARYGAEPTVRYDVWQHSQAGRVPGISATSVDLDTGAIPYNVTVPTAGELIDMDLNDKVRYKNREGRVSEITVHDCLARMALLFDDQQFGAPGQRRDGPWAGVFRRLAQKNGIEVPK